MVFDILSGILVIAVLFVGFYFLEKYSIKQADLLFQERVNYVLDEIDKRKSA